jgi:rhodanese-related sulfurtransferase
MATTTHINTEELRQLIDNKQCYVVDVREPDEYKAGHIPGSKNIPLGRVSQQTLSALKDKQIVFHCQSGVRSSKACDEALKCLDSDILNLAGGISEWKKAGGEIKKQGCRFSIMQQVQIMVGSMVLLGILLSQSHVEEWIYLSGFFGAGLLFAGLTGWCGMAKLLSAIPWNK